MWLVSSNAISAQYEGRTVAFGYPVSPNDDATLTWFCVTLSSNTTLLRPRDLSK